jgi:cytidylate kinase
MQEKDNLIVQGRVAWFFAKPSPFNVVNIFLAVAPEIGTQRTRQRAENADLTAAAMIRANTSRSNLEMQRYQALYHIENFLDPAHYDYTLDTSDLTENEVFEKVMAYLTVHKK